AETPNALDNMISPITNPLQFEDPRITTEVRPAYVYHGLDNDFVTQGGDVQLWAAQARIAITDRLGLIATKDGYLEINGDEVVTDANGSANLAGGLKYAVVMDEAAGEILTLGLRMEIPTGDPEVFQGQGDGILAPMVSGAMALGDFNVMGFTQLRLALDDDDSTFWDTSLHVDYPIGNFYPVVELHMFHVADAGNRIGLEGEGADVINFGSSGADGDTTLNMGVGARYRICKSLDVGVGYEFPLTNDEDVFGWRLTTDLIARIDWTLL
ncbi:MAG: hypothetical protein KDD44_12780, partial [Bdellovibrionales bacterium]|nr:hypothetical protein [Bdellovibrionales bacterium]